MSLPERRFPADSSLPVCGLTGTKILTTTDEQTSTGCAAAGRPSRRAKTLAATDFTVPWVAFGYCDCVGRSERDRHVYDYEKQDAEDWDHDGAGTSPSEAMLDINLLLEGTSQRPGTREVVLIGRLHVITASGDGALVGTRVVAPHIDAALEHRKSFSGRESNPAKDRRDFEFVTPVNLPGGRYAYEVT